MPEPAATSPIELKTEKLSKSFGEQVVLKDIDLTIYAGDIVAIVGASGSGKTVLLDNIVALIRPTSGRVLAADHNAPTPPGGQPPLADLHAISEDHLDLIRLHWAVVFQRNALFSGTVRENLGLWLREHTTLPEEEIDRRARESLSAVGLEVDEVLGKDRDALSGGMAKRVAIARAIACDPLVMFYDEPTTGLDPMHSGTIHELIFATHNRPAGTGFAFRDLGGKSPGRGSAGKRTTVIVTHDRDLLRRIRPRVVMLHESAVCFDGSYEAFGKSDCPPAEAYLATMPVLHARPIRPFPYPPGGSQSRR